MAAKYVPEEDQDVREKFSELRKELLQKLAVVKPGPGRTLRLYERGEAPCVYLIGVNKFAGSTSVIKGDTKAFWKLVKVGRTAADTTQTISKETSETPTQTAGKKLNRMEIVRYEVLKWCTGKKKKDLVKEDMKMAGIMFVLSIDHKSDDEMEEQVRKAFGLQIDKKLGKKLRLPVHTEWVLTSQPHIRNIRSEIERKKAAKEEITCDLILRNRFEDPKIPDDGKELILREVSVEINWTDRTVSEKAIEKKEKTTGATPNH